MDWCDSKELPKKMFALGNVKWKTYIVTRVKGEFKHFKMDCTEYKFKDIETTRSKECGEEIIMKRSLVYLASQTTDRSCFFPTTRICVALLIKRARRGC